jgi:hypothetical protein
MNWPTCWRLAWQSSIFCAVLLSAAGAAAGDTWDSGKPAATWDSGEQWDAGKTTPRRHSPAKPPRHHQRILK